MLWDITHACFEALDHIGEAQYLIKYIPPDTAAASLVNFERRPCNHGNTIHILRGYFTNPGAYLLCCTDGLNEKVISHIANDAAVLDYYFTVTTVIRASKMM